MLFPRMVYALRNTVTGRIYVGSSAKLKRRIEQHIILLRSGKHSIDDMQSDFDEYGEHFQLLVLDKCFSWPDRVKEYEWMDKLGSRIRGRGYNYKDPSKPKKPTV